MYKCTGCGGALKFDIPSQKLKCDYCSTLYDPESVDDVSEAADKGEDVTDKMSVNMFSCPSCGGTMYSSDDVAAGFCSFCGASSVLEGRLVKTGKPKYILPFLKTKEDCKSLYHKKLKGAIFAPKELKDPEFVDEFRGIYMPYWLYNIEQKGEVSLPVSETHRQGDYMVTNHYLLQGNIDAEYNGLSHDAASGFADNISESIAPYNVMKMKKFTPSYLSGFYADVADVKGGAYRQEAIGAATDSSMQTIEKSGGYARYTFPDKGNEQRLHTACKSEELAMFPVWFLAYRNKDRVAYATVNGQTGKVVCDIPVDIKKYLFGSLVLAIPIFLMLNLLFTFIPSVALSIITFISLIVSGLYLVEKIEINNENNNKKRKRGMADIVSTLLIIIVGFLTIIVPVAVNMGGVPQLLMIGLTVIIWISAICVNVECKQVNNMQAWVGPAIMSVASTVLLLLNPASDIWYYAAIILTEIAQLYCLTQLIIKYNIIATRKIPQFNTHKGGNDRA